MCVSGERFTLVVSAEQTKERAVCYVAVVVGLGLEVIVGHSL